MKIGDLETFIGAYRGEASAIDYVNWDAVPENEMNSVEQECALFLRCAKGSVYDYYFAGCDFYRDRNGYQSDSTPELKMLAQSFGVREHTQTTNNFSHTSILDLAGLMSQLENVGVIVARRWTTDTHIMVVHQDEFGTPSFRQILADQLHVDRYLNRDFIARDDVWERKP